MNRFSVVLARTLFVVICFAVPLLAESDYAATCKDKNKYHVFLNAAGRVVVEKRQD